MAITLPRKRYLFAATAGLAILFYTLKQADLKRLMQGLASLDPVWGLMAVAASILSYLCIAAVLHSLLKGMKHELSFSSSLKISLLSCTMNYVMAVGGLSGMAAKVYLLSKEKIPPSSTLSISMVHGFLTNTVAVVFIYLGFFYLYSEYKLSAREKDIGVLILMVAFVLTWVTIHAMISESFRKRLWRILDETGHKICGRLGRVCWFRQERAQTFFDRFNESMNLLVRSGRNLLPPAFFALIDWMFMFLCLKFSFQAINYSVDSRTLLVGFSVGIFSTLLSLTPASVGVMEGSMAGSFYLMGLDYENALLATLIYRTAYFLIPILVSFFFYRQFFSRPSEALPDAEGPPIP